MDVRLPLRRSDLEIRLLEGELVILDMPGGHVHRLNATASLIWNQCDGRSTAAEIAARLAAEFEVASGDALDDVVRTLAELRRLGLLADPNDPMTTR